MTLYKDMEKDELKKVKEELMLKFNEEVRKGRKYSILRGLPSDEMLSLASGLFNILKSDDDFKSENGSDVRQYGVLEGIPEARKFMSEILEVPKSNVYVGGVSSLSLIHSTISLAYSRGLYNSNVAWSKVKGLKMLCPAPGFDRHFEMSDYFGFELIYIPMLETGPDMDLVEKYVKDDSVKAILCVPKFSNPTGVTYSDETVRRLANLSPSAEDFVILYDNAYAVHEFDQQNPIKLLPLYDELVKNGNTNMAVQYASTSKISFPGGGITAIGTGSEQLAHLHKYLFYQTINFDKINQLRHVRFYKNLQGVREHMAKLSAIAKPKFEAVTKVFEDELGTTGAATWSNPKGGYFISLDVMEGCATRVKELADKIGVAILPTGSTFPYYKDPKEQNIRIAPTYPPVAEIREAACILSLCVNIAAVEKLLS